MERVQKFLRPLQVYHIGFLFLFESSLVYTYPGTKMAHVALRDPIRNLRDAHLPKREG